MKKLTHLDDDGNARMVDVGAKAVTSRVAVASARVRLSNEVCALIADQRIPKGDVFAAARVAGIMAAKKTPDLIPLCHTLLLDGVDVELSLVPNFVHIVATVKTTGRTGVEMEALTAASVAALTLYDMCKALDRGMVIEQVQLEEKRGGKSGVYARKTRKA